MFSDASFLLSHTIFIVYISQRNDASLSATKPVYFHYVYLVFFIVVDFKLLYTTARLFVVLLKVLYRYLFTF